jgi:hypothetical protein
VKYSKHKKNLRLRDKIVKLTLPLISAAINKKHMFKNREDIRQECALKVLQAVGKYDKKRGDGFGFMWTVICNSCLTHNERLSRPNLSLSTDESIQREAEVSGKEIFQTPENQHILNNVGKALIHTFSTNGFQIPKKRVHRKACELIRDSIASGEMFYDRLKIVRKLKKLGLDKKEIQYYCSYSLVVVREKLLKTREEASAVTHPKIISSLSAVTSLGD